MLGTKLSFPAWSSVLIAHQSLIYKISALVKRITFGTKQKEYVFGIVRLTLTPNHIKRVRPADANAPIIMCGIRLKNSVWWTATDRILWAVESSILLISVFVRMAISGIVSNNPAYKIRKIMWGLLLGLHWVKYQNIIGAVALVGGIVAGSVLWKRNKLCFKKEH